MEHIVLDPSIRDWCLFPMILMVLLVSMIRQYLTEALKTDKSVDLKDLGYKMTLTRSARLRKNGKFLCQSVAMKRKSYFSAKESGILRKEDLPGPQNPLSDPTKALEPLKNQMGSQIGFVATNAIMMGFSGHFFGGFILVHLPFLLTNRFKVMLQSGIDLATLDPSYVSSVSWYFLVMFGLRSFLNLIFVSGVAAEEDERMMQAQLGMGAQPPTAGFDCKAAFAKEADNLDMTSYSLVLGDVEKRLLGNRYPHQSFLDDIPVTKAKKMKRGGGSSGNSKKE